MTELFHTLPTEDTLALIHRRLDQGAAPAAVINELLPRTRGEALSWGRRLPIWEEYHPHYPDQVIALARLVSLRSMREHGLILREDGRVVERPAEGKPWKTPKPAATFPLTVGGEEVRVEYTPQYFPNSGTGMLYFRSPHEPAKPHALSESGHLSRFVSPDAVEACGGPQAYAALLAEVILHGKEKEFTEALEGATTEGQRQQQPQANRPAPQPGGYAERVLAEKEKTQESPQQGLLF